MARTERAQEFMRLFRLVNLDTHCDRMDCHGTHVDRIDWEIALRRSNEIGTIEVMAELDKEDCKQLMWVAYVLYARMRYGAQAESPPFRRTPPDIYMADVVERGFDPAEVCWACDDSNCPICVVPEGSNRLRKVITQERRIIRIEDYLARQDIQEYFFRDVYGKESDDDPILSA